MPARSAAPLLGALIRRQCLFYFLYPPSALSVLCEPSLFPRNSSLPAGQHNVLLGESPVRFFHGTAARRDDTIDNSRNHYETLKVPPTASASEIKKSFYNLSKTHHPDLHEAAGRRAAARRFMRISEAYATLSSPTKRAKYDRDHMALLDHHSAHGRHAHEQKKSSSYSSTGPAGGRPASGLSRRRGTFKGPPPSFYRSGGWGAQEEKRRAAHDQSTGGASSSGSGAGGSSGSGTGSGPIPGMGPGQTPFGHRDDIPHFDKEGHQRTGRRNDRRREARNAALAEDEAQGHGHEHGGGRGQRIVIERDRGVASMFFLVSSVLLMSFVGPIIISRLWYNTGQKPPKEKSP